MPKPKRSTKHERDKNVALALELIRDNTPFNKRIEILMEQSGKSKASCLKYSSDAINQLKQIQDRDNLEVRAEFVDGYMHDIKLAYKQFKHFNDIKRKDYNNADKWWRNYQDAKDKLLKFYPNVVILEDDELSININVVRLKKKK